VTQRANKPGFGLYNAITSFLFVIWLIAILLGLPSIAVWLIWGCILASIVVVGLYTFRRNYMATEETFRRDTEEN